VSKEERGAEGKERKAKEQVRRRCAWLPGARRLVVASRGSRVARAQGQGEDRCTIEAGRRSCEQSRGGFLFG